MLKPSALTKISIDDLLFVESNEISDFFIDFFELFERNRENNSFDMTDQIELITSQLKKTNQYRKKFDESVVDIVAKLFSRNKTVIVSKKSLILINEDELGSM